MKVQTSIMLRSISNYLIDPVIHRSLSKFKKSDKVHGFIFTRRDNLTKFFRLFCVRDTNLDAEVQALEDNVFKYFDVVGAILPDNVKLFTSNVLKEIS